MSVNITIPAEALEAGRKAFANAGTAEDHRDPFAEACIAMLKSWPMMLDSWSVFEEERQIILPLTQEGEE